MRKKAGSRSTKTECGSTALEHRCHVLDLMVALAPLMMSLLKDFSAASSADVLLVNWTNAQPCSRSNEQNIRWDLMRYRANYGTMINGIMIYLKIYFASGVGVPFYPEILYRYIITQ